MHDSGFSRVIGALISPEKTFRSIAERPTWVAPLLVLVLVTGLVGYLANQRIDFEQVIRHEMKDRDEEVSEEQLEQIVTTTGKIRPFIAVGTVIASPLLYLLLAAIFLVAFRLTGSEISFGQSFSVLLHAMLPWLVHGLLTLPLILRLETIGPEMLERGGVLVSSLAALAPEDASRVLLTLLASLDLFSIWTLVLLVIGYRAVARVSTATATGVVVTLWLLYVAGKLGYTAVFS
jgi:hypothetical protein